MTDAKLVTREALWAALIDALAVVVYKRTPGYLSDDVQTLVAAGDFNRAAEVMADEVFRRLPSGADSLDVAEWTREHRLCGPVYEGCYSHWPWDHCRADGTKWPCDVEHIRARLASPAEETS